MVDGKDVRHDHGRVGMVKRKKKTYSQNYASHDAREAEATLPNDASVAPNQGTLAGKEKGLTSTNEIGNGPNIWRDFDVYAYRPCTIGADP